MKNKGITLIELVVALGLLFLLIPLFWNYINSSVEDSGTVNNKVVVQSTVNALMNKVQADIQEAKMPINPTDYDEIDGDGFLICKPNIEGNPNGEDVLYLLNDKTVTRKSGFNWNISQDGTVDTEDETSGTIDTYENILEFTLEKVGNNGIRVHIRGEIDSKSGYTLDNTYYTRNTMF